MHRMPRKCLQHKVACRLQLGSLNTGELGFAKNQKWCPTSRRKIRFIDETYDVSTLYEESSSLAEDSALQDERADAESLEPPSISPINDLALIRGHTTSKLSPFRHDSSSNTGKTIASEGSDAFSNSPLSNQQTTNPSGVSTGQDSLTEHRPENQIRPLLLGQLPLLHWCDNQDAKLLRHFVETLAPVFDYGSHTKSFTTTIPQIATQSRSLFKAISAVSALSLKKIGSSPPIDEKRMYWSSHQLVGQAETHLVENLEEEQFLTTILLRLFDDLDGSLDYSMLTGDASVTQRQPPVVHLGQLTFADELRQDMSWAYLRLRLYFAIIDQQPNSVFLNISAADSLLAQEQDDHHWARRMVLHLHNVVNYCFGAEKEITTYQELMAYAQEWITLKPTSFDPVFIQEQQNYEVFPEIFVLSDSVALAWQLYHVSRILLVAHDPNRPLLGPGGAMARRSIDVSNSHGDIILLLSQKYYPQRALRKDAEIVCGIANSIGRTNSAHL